jgi:6-phosphofructo-2-kinase
MDPTPIPQPPVDDPPPLMERSKSALRRDVLQEKNELGPKLVIIMVYLRDLKL